MCNYIYKEMSCEHFFYLVESWCTSYIETQRRCKPNIVSKQFWGGEVCPACRNKQKPNTHPCAKLVRYNQRRFSPYEYGYSSRRSSYDDTAFHSHTYDFHRHHQKHHHHHNSRRVSRVSKIRDKPGPLLCVVA